MHMHVCLSNVYPNSRAQSHAQNHAYVSGLRRWTWRGCRGVEPRHRKEVQRVQRREKPWRGAALPFVVLVMCGPRHKARHSRYFLRALWTPAAGPRKMLKHRRPKDGPGPRVIAKTGDGSGRKGGFIEPALFQDCSKAVRPSCSFEMRWSHAHARDVPKETSRLWQKAIVTWEPRCSASFGG